MKVQISIGLCWVTVAALTVPAHAQPKTTLQSLPNGQYLLGKAPQPNRIGGKYIVLQKSGNTVLGLEYTRNTGEGYCFKGTLGAGEITKATIGVLPDSSLQAVEYVYNQKVDLKGFQLLKGADSQVNATQRISACRQTLAGK
jgi:hypothetical protein